MGGCPAQCCSEPSPGPLPTNTTPTPTHRTKTNQNQTTTLPPINQRVDTLFINQSKVDPLDDIDTINLELALSDLGQVEKRLERLSKGESWLVCFLFFWFHWLLMVGRGLSQTHPT